MPVITRDARLQETRSEEVFAWLSDPTHHTALVEGAFAQVTERNPGHLELRLATSPALAHHLTYEVLHAETEHGGRRVHVRLGGRRTRGTLRYSLRPAHPGPATLVTLHLDYDPGHFLGLLVDRLLLREALSQACDRLLHNLARLVPSA